MLLAGNVSDLINQVQLACEYPGQTMMVSLAIMLNFDDMVAAKEKGDTFARAAECQMVPGAGDAVGIALHQLESGIRSDLDSREMIEKLHARWSEYAGHQASYADRVTPGVIKAKVFESEFDTVWADWKSRSQERLDKIADAI